MEKPKILKSRKPDPEARAWREYIVQVQQETPKRLEDAAKFLTTMISVSLTLILVIGRDTVAQVAEHSAVRLALICMLLALLLAFMVMFPWRYRYSSESSQSIKAMHYKVVRVKDTLLILSFCLFLLALATLVMKFFI